MICEVIFTQLVFKIIQKITLCYERINVLRLRLVRAIHVVFFFRETRLSSGVFGHFEVQELSDVIVTFRGSHFEGVELRGRVTLFDINIVEEEVIFENRSAEFFTGASFVFLGGLLVQLVLISSFF
jgi:hypothetical protein